MNVGSAIKAEVHATSTSFHLSGKDVVSVSSFNYIYSTLTESRQLMTNHLASGLTFVIYNLNTSSRFFLGASHLHRNIRDITITDDLTDDTTSSATARIPRHSVAYFSSFLDCTICSGHCSSFVFSVAID